MGWTPDDKLHDTKAVIPDRSMLESFMKSLRTAR